MPERSLEGIQITETPGAEQPIARASAQLTAFVGRTLRGPRQPPILIQQLRGFSAAVRRPVAAEPAVLRSRAFLRAGRTAGRHRSRRERRGAGHAVAALWPRDVAARSARAGHARVPARLDRLRSHRRRRRAALQPGRAARALAGLGAHRGAGNFPRAVDRSGIAALRRRRAARIEPGARARRGAVGASRSHADARHEPAGRLRELQSRRRRRPPDQRLRRDRLRDAALRPVRARRRRRARLLIYTAADAHDRRRRQHGAGRGEVLPPAARDADRRSAGRVGQRCRSGARRQATELSQRPCADVLPAHRRHRSAARPHRDVRQRRRGRGVVVANRRGRFGGDCGAGSGAAAARGRAAGSRSGASRSLVARGSWRQRAAGGAQRGSRAAAAANAGVRRECIVGLVVSLAAPFRAVRDQLDRARHALVRAASRRSDSVGARRGASAALPERAAAAPARSRRCRPTRRST